MKEQYIALIFKPDHKTFMESYNQTPEEFLKYVRMMYPKPYTVIILKRGEQVIGD